MRSLPVAALSVLLLAGCDRDAPFGPLPPGEASVGVQAYYEYDHQSGFGGADVEAAGLRFQLVLPGSETPVVEGVADAMGIIALERVPVGTYDLRVAPSFLADTLVLADIDTTRITLVPDGAVTLSVGVTPPTRTLAEARSLPAGRRVWVEGIALNDRSASIDQSVHLLAGDSMALRASLPTSPGGSEGDSVKVLGRTTSEGSTRYLADGFLVVLADALRPVVPLDIEAAEVADAGGGVLDARLVVVRNAVVADTATVPSVGRRITVQDGDDTFVAILRSQNGFDGPVVPGMPVDALAGLLVPDTATPGAWVLVPRSRGDALFGQPAGGA